MHDSADPQISLTYVFGFDKFCPKNRGHALCIVARVDTVAEVDSEETSEADTAEMMIEVVLINSENEIMT